MAPFSWEDDHLHCVVLLPKAGPRCVSLAWSTGAHTVRVAIPGQRIRETDRQSLRDQVRWMFRADEDFSEFWTLCRSHPALRHCALNRTGALLRSATVFEDVVKTICTVNCHWRNTKRMVANLCRLFGEPCPGIADAFAFPMPEQLAAASDHDFQEARLGFRARYIRELARRVVDGELDLDAWRGQQDPEVLRPMLLGVKGIGSYGANHMLMLLGHYGMIPCDSEVRAYMGISAKVSARDVERKAARRYGRWGRFAFLAYKFERVFCKQNYVDCPD